MSWLEQILEAKRGEIAQLQPRRKELRKAALLRNDFRSFRSALQRDDGKLALIAEVKKASPSAGVIVENFDPVAIARNYARAGVEAISVLTDEPFFQGHLEHLRAVREVVRLPVLRKNLILDELQILEASAAGADAILLIVAALSDEALVRLLATAATYQLDTLVEVHSFAELERALAADAEMVGINNRNLATFEVDLSVTEKLAEEVPKEIVLVSESGIRTAQDLARIKESGVNAVLIGEALVRAQSGLNGSLLSEPR